MVSYLGHPLPPLHLNHFYFTSSGEPSLTTFKLSGVPTLLPLHFPLTRLSLRGRQNFKMVRKSPPPSPYSVHNYNQSLPLTVFSIHGWESTDTEGQLYALSYTILHKGLEHP